MSAPHVLAAVAFGAGALALLVVACSPPRLAPRGGVSAWRVSLVSCLVLCALGALMAGALIGAGSSLDPSSFYRSDKLQ